MKMIGRINDNMRAVAGRPGSEPSLVGDMPNNYIPATVARRSRASGCLGN